MVWSWNGGEGVKPQCKGEKLMYVFVYHDKALAYYANIQRLWKQGRQATMTTKHPSAWELNVWSPSNIDHNLEWGKLFQCGVGRLLV
jgi:hypothetical protein